MTLEVLHPFGACSCVLMYDFPYGYTKREYIDYIHKFFDKTVEHLGHKYAFNKYAFFVVSTYKDNPKVLCDLMKEIGFSYTNPTYNEKNETTVQLWTIPVSLLIKNVEQMKEKMYHDLEI